MNKTTIKTALNEFFKRFFYNRNTYLVIMTICFVGGVGLGSRAFKYGMTGKYITGDFKGENILINGACITNNNSTIILNDDQVQISSQDNNEIRGVVRKNREYVICDPLKVSIDVVPVNEKLFGATEIKIIEKTQVQNEILKIEKKTVLLTGTCQFQDKPIEPFTDELFDVYQVKGNGDNFTVRGILKATNQELSCFSYNIKYTLLTQAEVDSILEKKRLKELEKNKPVPTPTPVDSTVIGKELLVTGTCVKELEPGLDKTVPNQKLVYDLVNTRMKILEYREYKDGKVSYIRGAVVEESGGSILICDVARTGSIFIEKMDQNVINYKTGGKNE